MPRRTKTIHRSRHLIPMFIGTPFTLSEHPIFSSGLLKEPRSREFLIISTDDWTDLDLLKYICNSLETQLCLESTPLNLELGMLKPAIPGVNRVPQVWGKSVYRVHSNKLINKDYYYMYRKSVTMCAIGRLWD